MEEVFEFDCSVVSYDRNIEAVVFVWKKSEHLLEHRTALMEAVELLRRHKCETLVLDRTYAPTLNNHDVSWEKKVIFKLIKKHELEKIYVVDPEYTDDSFPYNSLPKKLTVSFEDSMEVINAKLSKKVEGEKVSPELIDFTIADARKHMGLEEECSIEAIEERFWKLSKVISNDTKLDSEEKRKKLTDLSFIYDVASGKKELREKEALEESLKKKYFGKTKDQWVTFISYTWWIGVLAIVVIAVLSSLIWTMFFKPRSDYGVLGACHFAYEGEGIRELLENEMGFKNPYVNIVDVVAYNQENESSNIYSDAAATLAFYSSPSVLITDEYSNPFYFEAMADISALYERLDEVLTPEQMEKITPVYLSKRDSMEIINEFDITLGSEEKYDLDEYSDEEIMIGVLINDPVFMESFGLYDLWKESDPGIIFSICSKTKSVEVSEDIIIQFFKRL